MAISKDDTVLTYSKFKEFWTQFAVLFNKKLDGTGVANNDTTTDSGYVLDARVGKTHGDEIDKLNDQMNGIYLATNSAGKWGFKTSKNGAVTPFRQPTGNAVAANVLVGKTFANADSDSLTGTMPNNGEVSATLTPSGNNTTTKTIPAGYTTGGTITADGRTAYAAGQKEPVIKRLGSLEIGSHNGTQSGNGVTFSIKNALPSNYKSITTAHIFPVLEKHGGYRSGPGDWTDGTVSKSYDASTGIFTLTHTWTEGNGISGGGDTYTYGIYVIVS